MKPWHVAIAGANGVGKTTLSRSLAAMLQWKFIAESAEALAYIEDLKNHPDRWALEAQLAFFAFKAARIASCLSAGESIIVDRSLEEDSAIYSRHWRDRGHIPERGMVLYDEVSRLLSERISSPDLLLILRCRPDEAQVRQGARRSVFSETDARDLWTRYDHWIGSKSPGRIAVLDTDRWDVRDESTARAIARDVQRLLSQGRHIDRQLQLFDTCDIKVDCVDVGGALEVLVVEEGENQVDRSDARPAIDANRMDARPLRSAYIAAPFSGVATIGPAESMLFQDALPHGVIGRGAFRSMLIGTAQALRQYGVESIIPHRDVNHWGNRRLGPTEVVRRCTDEVTKCDLFLGFLANSCGSHYEFGLAVGLRKPCLLIQCDEIGGAFFASGATGLIEVGGPTTTSVLVVECRKMQDVARLLSSNPVATFLRSVL